MIPKVFLNLPVDDLERATRFYTAIGATVVEQFSDEKAVTVAFSDDIYAILQTKAYFSTFTIREIIDAHDRVEAIFAFAVENRARVDEIADAALAAGGSPVGQAVDLGFMYRRSFQDPDGHQLEALHMDLAKAPSRPQPHEAIVP